MSHKTSAPPTQIDWQRHALFLDFDGTLAPIVDTPDVVAVDAPVREALARLQTHTGGALAVISGRALDDLEKHLEPFLCPMSGSHGVEISLGDGKARRTAEGTEQLGPALKELAVFAARHDLMLENKPGAVTIHYRSSPELAHASKTLVDRIANSRDGLRGMHGNMVSEVALANIDKGSALASFMETAPFKGRLPFMAGDDVTDEDAFKAAQRLQGYGIKIGPGATSAIHRFADTRAFLRWLCKVAGDSPQ